MTQGRQRKCKFWNCRAFFFPLEWWKNRGNFKACIVFVYPESFFYCLYSNCNGFKRVKIWFRCKNIRTKVKNFKLILVFSSLLWRQSDEKGLWRKHLLYCKQKTSIPNKKNLLIHVCVIITIGISKKRKHVARDNDSS